MKYTILAVLVFSTVAAAAPAMIQQDVTVMSGSAPINLVRRPVGGAFVTSNSTTFSFEDELKRGAIMKGAEVTIGAVGGSMMRIPIVGPAVLGRIGNLFHIGGGGGKNVTKGFNITFLRELSATAVVPASGSSFVLPAQAFQGVGAGASPVLLKITPSSKDNARLIRATHVSITRTNSQINPMQTEILGVEETTISCHTETRGNGDIVVIPDTPLQPGEYVIAAADSVTKELFSAAWDFKVQ